MAMNKLRLEFAVAGFLGMCRRQYVKLHPGVESPIKNLTDYPEAERSALMAAIERAIQYAGEDGDKAFEVWKERRAAAEQA